MQILHLDMDIENGNIVEFMEKSGMVSGRDNVRDGILQGMSS